MGQLQSRSCFSLSDGESQQSDLGGWLEGCLRESHQAGRDPASLTAACLVGWGRPLLREKQGKTERGRQSTRLTIRHDALDGGHGTPPRPLIESREFHADPLPGRRFRETFARWERRKPSSPFDSPYGRQSCQGPGRDGA